MLKNQNTMINRNSEERESIITLDLLSDHSKIRRYIPQFLRRENDWKVYSGKWIVESPDKITCRREPRVTTGENISITGSSRWSNIIFKATVRMLNESLKPPEGGTIIYFNFKNIRNFYSFHFCLYKQKVEFFKRCHSDWTLLAEQPYDLQSMECYSIRISTKFGHHQCSINGATVLSTHDSDISHGYVGIGAKYCDVEFSRLSVSVPAQLS